MKKFTKKFNIFSGAHIILVFIVVFTILKNTNNVLLRKNLLNISISTSKTFHNSHENISGKLVLLNQNINDIVEDKKYEDLTILKHKNIKDTINKQNGENISDKDKNNKSNNEKSKSNSSNDDPLKGIENEELRFILQYKGGEIEPEWNWIRNISIVYTWVDGSDIDFAEEKSKFNGGIKTVSSRDRSADELRYSIRSVQKYLPWHNGTLYILTNNQTPHWIDTSNPRLRIIHHKDIFPKNVCPTYDSSTIELFLDKIPGITERFIYINDDFFINNYIHPSYFFTPKNFYPKIYRGNPNVVSKEKAEEIIEENSVAKLFQAMKYFTTELAKEYFDKNFVYRDLYHSPYVYYRDLLEPYRELFKDEIKIILSDRFRNGHKFLIQYLFHVYMEYALNHPDYPLKLGGNGKAKDFEGKPFPEDLHRTIDKYRVVVQPAKISDTVIKFCKITDSTSSNEKYFNLVRTRPHLLVYNFNDEYREEKSFYEFSEFMITYNPEPSEFEKKEYVELEAKYLKDYQNAEKEYKFEKERINRIKNEYLKIKMNEKISQEFRRNRREFIIDYITRKNALWNSDKILSDHEKNEIELITTYDGKELSSEWEWIKKISIVYIVDNNSKDKENEEWILEDSLKYSLRSIQKYLPWFKGKIILISQSEENEGLSWVKNEKDGSEDDTSIEIIHYKDIIPTKYYPTMNKHLIEMYLDKIPKLTEKFIYLKDTHFFNHYIHPRFFFSEQFYPKYFFRDSIPYRDSVDQSKDSFDYTYDILVKYFDKSYLSRKRHHLDAPFVLYRDLFEPARQLFEKYVEETCQSGDGKGLELLPLYMVQNYNIYGTAQPFYPDYVAGYGAVRDAQSPKLNPERTVSYYGFDIPSQEVNNATIYSRDFHKNNQVLLESLSQSENESIDLYSFSLQNSDFDNDIQPFNEKEKQKLIEFLKSHYDEKSIYEN